MGKLAAAVAAAAAAKPGMPAISLPVGKGVGKDPSMHATRSWGKWVGNGKKSPCTHLGGKPPKLLLLLSPVRLSARSGTARSKAPFGMLMRAGIPPTAGPGRRPLRNAAARAVREAGHSSSAPGECAGARPGSIPFSLLFSWGTISAWN